MSRPATFFTTMPPLRTSLPSSVAKVMPITMSRAVPYKRRRGPLEFVARTPPTVASPRERRIERDHLPMLRQDAGQLAPAQSGLDADGQVVRFIP